MRIRSPKPENVGADRRMLADKFDSWIPVQIQSADESSSGRVSLPHAAIFAVRPAANSALKAECCWKSSVRASRTSQSYHTRSAARENPRIDRSTDFMAPLLTERGGKRPVAREGNRIGKLW